MGLRGALWGYRAALLSALGLSPMVSCGGSTPEEGQAVPCGASPSAERNTPGYRSCGLATHRSSKEACSATPRSTQESCPATGSTCTSDADCTSREYGLCSRVAATPGCSCTYGCVTDSDCDAGFICHCYNSYGQCAKAACTVDSDCKNGALCLTYQSNPGCYEEAFACQTTSDTCASNGDCPDGEVCGMAGGARHCLKETCTVGRPFMVGGAARVAPLSARGAWRSELAPCLDGIGADDRAAMARAWTDVALMEHASIAAFARFALELLSLGAPAALLEATHAAMTDETTHARDAFALASAYAGRAIGPGAFPMAAASLAARAPCDIVRTAILEGCIGETIAAIEAAQALSQATDPAVREALTKVAADEANHATLAWQFVQWVVATEAGLRDVALRELALVARTKPEPAIRGAAAPSIILAAHGVLDERTRAEVRRQVIADVVVPCATALVASAGRLECGLRERSEPAKAAGGAVAKRAAGGQGPP